MAITLVGSASGADSVTLPTHAVGDLILIVAFQLDGTSVLPNLPAGYTNWYSSSTGSYLYRVAFKIATSTSDSSGSWGSNNLVCAHVYRGIDQSDPLGGIAPNLGTTDAGIKYSIAGGVPMDKTNGSSWVAIFGGASGLPQMGTAPTGATVRNAQFAFGGSKATSFDTNGGVTGYTLQTVSSTGSADYRTVAVEIRENPNTGIFSQALQDDTLSSTAATDKSGNLSQSLQDDILASTSQTQRIGDLNQTLIDDSLSSTAQTQRISDLNQALSDDVISSIGVHGLEGNLTATLEDDTSKAVALHDIPGNLTQTLTDDTISSTGETQRFGITTQTLSDDTFIAFGAVELFANLTQTLDNDTLSSVGIHGLGGSLSQNLQDDSLDALATQGVNGSLTQTLNDDTLTSSTSSEPIGNLIQTLIDDILTSSTETQPIGVLDQILEDDILMSSAYTPPNGHLTQTLDDDILTAHAASILYANLSAVLEDDYLVYPQVAPDKCCALSVCNITEESLVCNFINLLPTGPMWDNSKKKAIAFYQNRDDEPHLINQCSSVALHSVYTAIRLHKMIMTGLFPVLREANPATAFVTMDSWLDRYRWVDCFYGSCRDSDLGELTPFEFPTDCGPIFCEVDTPDSLQDAVKHALILALTRLQLGGIVTFDYLNWIIEPLSARLEFLTTETTCPLVFSISPASDVLPLWQKMTCDEYPQGTITAWFDPNECYNRGLPTKIWPGVLAAECIARSLLKNKNVNIKRMCD